MRDTLPLKARIMRVLVNEYSALTLLLGLSATLLAIGFIVNRNSFNSDHNYASLVGLAPASFWTLSFLVYGVIKIISCFSTILLKFEIAISVYGLWLWTYIVFSFIIFDTKLTTPTDMILLVTLICESWVLAIILYNNKNHKGG